MKKSIFYFSLLALSLSQCCKDNNEESIKYLNSLSAEMMSYFVDYQVGTKWIYQDTLNLNNYDTIELVSKESYDVNNGSGTLSKGYVLYYKPKKSKDFKVFVSPGVNNTYYVKVDPLVTAAGKIVFENNNGKWTTRVLYYDSLEIYGTKYYNVIYSPTNNMYQYEMRISKSQGIVFFIYNNPAKQESGFYNLLNIIKP
jgi:hypothetical protein